MNLEAPVRDDHARIRRIRRIEIRLLAVGPLATPLWPSASDLDRPH